MGARVGDLPAVRVSPTTRPAANDHFPRCQQRCARPPIRPIGDPRRRAQALGRDALHDTVLVRQGSHRGEEQARGPAGGAVAKHRLEQLRVDLALPPRTRVGERKRDGARAASPARGVLHDDQAAADQLGARVEEAATRQPGSASGRRRAGAGVVLAIGEARQRERRPAAPRTRDPRAPAPRQSPRDSPSAPRWRGAELCVAAESHRQLPRERCRSSRQRSAQPRRKRRNTRLPRGSVLGAARLLRGSCAAPNGAYLFGRPGGNPVFRISGPEAVRDCAAAAGVGDRLGADPFPTKEGVVGQPEPWPVCGPLATDVGICGQIDGNPLVIQRDLATDWRAEILRNPCSDGVIRAQRPTLW